MLRFTQLCEIEQFCEDARNAVAGQFSCLLVDVAAIWRMTHAPDSGRHPYAVAEHKPALRCDWCFEAIDELRDARAGTASSPYHAECWQERERRRIAYWAECEENGVERDRAPRRMAAGSETRLPDDGSRKSRNVA